MQYFSLKYLITALTILLPLLSHAQAITLEVQKGLSDPVKWIVPAGEDQVLLGTGKGQFLFWNPSTNQLSSLLNVSQGEVNSILYISSEKVLAIAGSEGVSLYKRQDNETKHLHEIPLQNATALHFADQELVVASSSGVIVSGKLLHDNWVASERFETGISGVYNVKLKGHKLIVIGIHHQKVYDKDKKKVLSESKHYNTSMYASYWDNKKSVMYLPREGDILKLDFSGKRIESNYISLFGTEGELVTGLTSDQVSSLIYAATNSGRILRTDKNNRTEIIKVNENNSFTSLLYQDGLLFTGDYFGQTELLETKNWQLVNRVNEDTTPSLNGVYATKGGNYFISTHFGAKGSAIKVWSMKKANLEHNINLPQQKIYRLYTSSNADSIYSFHTDGATWLHIRNKTSYTSSLAENALIDFAVGWNISLVDEEPMINTMQSINHLLQLQNSNGKHSLKFDEKQEEGILLHVNVIKPDKNSRMPAFNIMQGHYSNSGVMPYIQELDILDRDMLYMKLKGKPVQEFLGIAKTKGIPEKNALSLYELMNGSIEPSHILLTDALGNTLAKVALEKPLKFVTRTKSGYQFFFEDELIFWDRQTGKIDRRSIEFSNNAYVSAYMNNSLLLADEHSIKIYPLLTADSTFTGWVGFENDDYLVYNQNMNYKIKGQSKRLIVKQDDKLIPFDAVDISLNRPDVILKQIPAADSVLASLYTVAIQKREKRAKAKSPVYQHQPFHFLLQLQTASSVPLLSSGKTLKPVFAMVNQQNSIVLDFWVNGVKSRSSGLTGRTLTPVIDLSPGLNKIDWQLSSNHGDTILSRSTNYVYHPSSSKDQGKVWYYGAGVNQYADSSMNLNFSRKDIIDISGTISSKYKGATVATLVDREVTKGNVMKWQRSLQQTSIDDVVIVSFSGHGLLTESTDFYFCTHNTDFKDPAKEGLSIDDLVSLLDSSPSRKKVLLLDACQSGLFDEDEMEVRTADAIAIGIKARGVKAVGLSKTSVNANAYALLQEEFASLQRHNGTIVIAASGGKEYAFESDTYQNGVFTYALLTGLKENAADSNKDGNISIEELKVYLGNKVQELTKGKQKPTSRQENLGIDWVIW
jgi:hypothetical protein